MRRVLGRNNSSNVMKVVWLLDELGLPFERLDVGGPFGGTDTPDYRAMNPHGLVPTLQEGRFTLWESNAILRYLGAAYGDGGALWPREPQARAAIDAWMDWQQTTMAAPMSAVFGGLVRTAPEQRDMAAIDRQVARAAELWALVDAQAARHAFVAGPAFTLGDVTLGPAVHRWFNMALTRPDLPHLRAWYDRLLARPAYAEHIAGVAIT